MAEAKKDLKEIIKEEYIRCASDPIYFIKKYCMIVHQKRGKVPFTLYDFQENVLAAFIKHRRIVILKNRQMGLSTLSAAYALWMMTFKDNKYVLVIATKQDVAKNLIDKVRLMWSNLPSWLRQNCIEDNKLGQVYKNGSKIFAGTSTGDSGRSEAAALLIIDEAAFISGMSELWSALQPTVSTGGDIIILSTPNGIGNWYHEVFTKAEENKNNFFPITLHWTMHPDRDQAWRDQQDVELGPRLAKQECDGSFLSSGDNVISGEVLEWYNQTYIKDPQFFDEFDRNIWIWEKPDFNRNYITVADVARGDGEDYSTFHIFDIESLTQVAEYQGKISTSDFGNMLVNYSTTYNDALLVVENNGVGWAVIQRILDRKYKNLYYTEQKNLNVIDDTKSNKIRNDINRLQKKSVPGFYMSGGDRNSHSRSVIISKMEEYFNNREIIIHSKRLLNELLTFVWINGRQQPVSKQYHDDLIMPISILLWVKDVALRIANKRKDLTMKALDAIKIDRVSAIYQSVRSDIHNPRFLNISENERFDLNELL